MAQGAGVHLDARQLVVGVADVGRAELGEPGLDVLQVQKAAVRQHGVVALHGVAFAEHKAVPVGVIHRGWRDVQVVFVEHQQGVEHAHIAADVAPAAGHDDVGDIGAEFPAERFQFLRCHSVSPLQ